MALQLPSIQYLTGYSGKSNIVDEFAKGFGLTSGIRNEEDAQAALGDYVKSLYMGGQPAQQQPPGAMGYAAPGNDTGTRLINGAHDAAATAVDPTLDAYFGSIRAAESGGNDAAKNPNSTATGRYQFTEGTWNGLAEQHPELGLTPDGRTDPAQQERAIRAFTNDNIGVLRGKGIPVNPANLYASHFLGAGGATDVLGLDDNTPMVSAVPPEVVQANPFLAEMTVGQFKQWSAEKAGNGSGGYQAPQAPVDLMGAAPQPAPAGNGLPPREVLMALFRNPLTRGFGQELVAAAQTGTEAPKPSADMVKFLEAQDNPAFAQFLRDNKDGTTVDVEVNSGSDDFYTAADKKRGEDFVATEIAGTKAASSLAQLSRLEQLLEAAPQGMEGGWKGFVGQFGIDSEGLDDIQAAQALINSMVPDQRAPGSGTMSDADLALFKASIPQVINQPGGNALIIQTLRGISMYDQEIGRIATKVLDRDLTPAHGRAEMAKVANPLDSFRTASQRTADSPPEGVTAEEWAVMTPEERAAWQ